MAPFPLSFLLFIAPSANTLWASAVDPKAQTSWEQTQSKLLFEKANLLEKEGKLEDAIQEYSEIIEFFPRTEHWAMACIRLSGLHLFRKNIEASEELLERLIQSKSNKGDTKIDILMAQWDFFFKLSRFSSLLQWMQQRSDEEKKALRLSPLFTKYITKLAKKEEVDIQIILGLYKAAKFESPIEQTLRLNETNEFLFNEKQMGFLLKEAMVECQSKLISQACRNMMTSGWHINIHKVFLQNKDNPQKSKWVPTWLNALIEGKMWSQAAELLKELPTKEYLKENYLVFTGLEDWEKAYALLKEADDWVYSVLSFQDLNLLMRGLHAQEYNRFKAKEIIEQIPQEGKKLLLVAEYENKDEAKEPLYKEVIAKHTVYAEIAFEKLAAMYFKQAKQKELGELSKEIEKQAPNSKVRTEIGDYLKMLSTIKTQKGDREEGLKNAVEEEPKSSNKKKPQPKTPSKASSVPPNNSPDN
ncbi:MAG: hypothetical protein HQL32_17905 [Planctomycetes bacterium]|nr:hypothetical protein [Planctomycetota bacterium]